MNTILPPVIFYVIIAIYIVCQYRNKGLGVLISTVHFDKLKYHIGIVLYFFGNINVLFYCSLCGHCQSLTIAFIMSAVLVGAAVYLTHLINQTINAVRQIMSGNEFDFMAPFFSIPYFVLIYEIIDAALNAGLDSLHGNESRMLIAMLYPFFVVLGELSAKIKAIKGGLK